MKIIIKASTGTTTPVDADPAITVAEFKAQLEGPCGVPAAQQRLIYKGHIMKDPLTLESYSSFRPQLMS
jgi:ubiquilin